MAIRVVVADDQPLIRGGFRALLDSEADITVAARAGDGVEAVKAVAAHRPDLVLLNVQMPVMDGSPPPAGSPATRSCPVCTWPS